VSTISLDIARKVLETVDAGLVCGVGKPVPGQMCVEAAVCYAMGMPHGDNPSCVSDAVRAFKIRLNDSAWSSDAARANGLRRIAIAQLGSAGVVDDRRLVELLSEKTIRVVVPIALRAAAKANPAHAEKLETCAVACEQHGTAEAAAEAAEAARAARAAAARAAAARAAALAAQAARAAVAAARAAVAATYAARAAVAATYAARAAVAAGDGDRILTVSAGLAIDVLRELGSPGIPLMDQLCPLEGGAK
jgi:hypothetical protein